MRRPERQSRPPRHLRVAAVFALPALLIATLLGGFAFVWCAPMQRAMVRSCCPAPHADEATRGAPALDQPCCEDRRLASLPTLDLASPLDLGVLPPALVAVISLALWFSARGMKPIPRSAFAMVRARGPPGRRRHLVLSVFRN